MGGLLAGIEDRIAAFVLASGDGGLVSHKGTGGVRERAVVTASSRTPQALARRDEANRTDQVDRPRRRAHPVPVGSE
jgi:hypothetical protein